MNDPSPTMLGLVSPLATFRMRASALAIDAVVMTTVAFLLGALFGTSPQNANVSLLGIAYFTLFEGSPSGQTVGKRLMGIRVVDLETGRPIGFGRALARHLCRTVSVLCFLMGYLWMLRDKERQTWHDKLVWAVVVRERVYPVTRWPGW